MIVWPLYSCIVERNDFRTVKDGWMDDLRFYVLFNSFSIIPGDDGRMIMKDFLQWNPVSSFPVEKIFASVGHPTRDR